MAQTFSNTLPRPVASTLISAWLPTPSLRAMLAMARQRRQLAALGASRLDDLGLSREQALTEAQRPFWDAPGAWRR